MILEGIVTSVSPAGEVNIAPMGPRVESGCHRFLLRPFPTSQTYRNLLAHREGVFHLTDDVLLLSQSAVHDVEPKPLLVPASKVKGHVLADACRYYEFKIISVDDSEPRIRMEAETVHCGRLRDFSGFNRAKHAVLEAAILATRTDFLPFDDIQAEFQKLHVIVEKTGDVQEKQAFEYLQNYVHRVAQQHQDPQQPSVP